MAIAMDRLQAAPNLAPTGNQFKVQKGVKSRENSSMAYALRHQLLHACTLEFDGVCRGNPGPSGAGAVIRSQDGRVIHRLREGVGYATDDVAEYRALIFGLMQALSKGYKHIHVRGDSELVCNQVSGLWRVSTLVPLYNEVTYLRNMFETFTIGHVPKEHNMEADFQANLGVRLADGAMEEERELLW